MARKKKKGGWFGDSKGHRKASKGKQVPWAKKTKRGQAKLNINRQSTLDGGQAVVITPDKKIDDEELKEIEEIAAESIYESSEERVRKKKQAKLGDD
ncbi:MAG: hypothetical protein ACOC53_05340 [Candidatus Saliniplasma sp.]